MAALAGAYFLFGAFHLEDSLYKDSLRQSRLGAELARAKHNDRLKRHHALRSRLGWTCTNILLTIQGERATPSTA